MTGDYFVVRTGGLAAKIIRFVTRSDFNHAGVVVADDGRTVEAKPSGACFGNLSDYGEDEMRIGTPVALSSATRRHIVAHAGSMIGTPYYWLDILSLALLQYRIRPAWVKRRVERTDRLICSQLVDLAFSEAGVELFSDGRTPQDVTPGELAVLLP